MEVAPETDDTAEIDRQIQEAYENLDKLQQEEGQLDSPEDFDNYEQEILLHTNLLGALILQKKLQAKLDSEAHRAAEAELMKAWPGRMKNEGYERVKVLTASGFKIELRVRYYRRTCDRLKNKKYKGVYPGLILLGIHERCTPKLASIVSSWAALLCSFDEVRQVLQEQGIQLGEKVITKLAYRYAERARIMQQTQQLPLGEGDNLQGRRVVVSADGGRTRLRENKPGRRTEKNRKRYKGAWREPKLFIIYVVDAKGKLEKSFAPLIDGVLEDPDAVFRLLRSYLKSLQIQATHLNRDKIPSN